MTVAAARVTQIQSGETRGERAAWALLSLDPIVLAAAVLAVEGDFGRATITEYDLTGSDGELNTVRSRYIVQLGDCVLMRRSDDSAHVILVSQPASACTAP